jgi:hypothetical protein
MHLARTANLAEGQTYVLVLKPPVTDSFNTDDLSTQASNGKDRQLYM